MLRTAMLLGVVLMVVGLGGAYADDPPFGFTGDWYRISPVTLYGELPDDDITVEAASPLVYYYYTTDVDSVQEYYLGQPLDDPVESLDYTQYDSTRTDINSCPTPTITHETTHEADDLYTNVWRLNGSPQGPLEQTAYASDAWYALDYGQDYIIPEIGTKNDPDAGPEYASVTVTPNCGWIYGTVSGGGGGIPYITVKLYVGTQYLREVTANGSGYYTFHYVAAGNYTVKATTAMGKTGQASAAVSKGAGTLANITINP